MTDVTTVTANHIARVGELGRVFISLFEHRLAVHDASKFNPIEMEPLQRMQDLINAEGPAPFGSAEYRRRTDMLGPMIAHHYANNSHHPEHYSNGVAGMDLLDLVEMFVDWKAASERGAEPAMNMSFAIEKYRIEPQLASILKNTADRMGFAWK